MKRLISSGAALLLTVGSALAADLPMPVKAPPIIVPPILWTGLILGGSVGAGFGGNSGNEVSGKDLFCVGAFCSGSSGSNPPPPVVAPNSGSGNNTSFAGGGQLGYNFQISPYFVVGGVADFTWIGRSSGSSFTTSPVTIPGVIQTSNFTESTRSDWLATFRLRGGPTFDRLWLYLTGGLALADLQSSSSSVTTWSGPALVPTTQIAASGSGSTSGPALGWVVGAGAEYKITPNWGIFGEYLYYDVRQSYTVAVTTNPAVTGGAATSGSFGVDAKVNGSLVKFGLNYTFLAY